MRNKINRRDFLKITGFLSAQAMRPHIRGQILRSTTASPPPNVLIIVFDAWSAYHLSIYGYPRETMPNLAGLADRAIVYHNHHSAGNFTTPGTASLLTGVMPWSHRATSHNARVKEAYVTKNMFHEFSGYYRVGYSHNFLVNTLLDQFVNDIDEFIPRSRLFLGRDRLVEALFQNDEDIATVGWARGLKQSENNLTYSLFFSKLYKKMRANYLEAYSNEFPLGLPSINVDNYYTLEMGTDHLQRLLVEIPEPFFGYFHFLPPHEPYRTRREFVGYFRDDGFHPTKKTPHFFSQGQKVSNQRKWRERYDEFILYVDAEFSRLFNFLDQTGVLDNTWLILTSDHGELFERGIIGHLTQVLHQPVIRIPLIIFEPGRIQGLHIFDTTSSVDILPTLLHLSDREIPDWIEGEVVPPFRDSVENNNRQVFSFEAKGATKDQPILTSTTAIILDQYKLMQYVGYQELLNNKSLIELYDLENDPHELYNLYPIKKTIADDLLAILNKKMTEINNPYQ